MTTLNVDVDKVWVAESPIDRPEGTTETIIVRIVGGGTLSSPSAKVYKKKKDVTATVMPSGTTTASANTVILKPITSLVGNSKYVVDVTATANGNIRVYKFMIRTQKVSQEQ
jgi:hypothetical protein